MKRWRFATRTMQLGRLATTPAGSFWTCAFQLPGDRLGLPDAVFDRPAAESVAGGRPFTAYEIFEDAIHTEAERLWVRYRWLAPIAIWPALFRECVTLALASDCAAAINEDDRRRDDLRREVYGDPRMPGSLGLLGKASSMDAQSSPSRIAGVEVGALLDVRRAGA
jgi:hypothetical protein